MIGVGIEALARQKKISETTDIIFFQIVAVGIFFLDGAKSCRSPEQNGNSMLRNDAPESARIRCPDWFSFVEDGGASIKQGSIDNIGMTDNPADIGRGPENFARLDIIDILHRPFQGHGMAAVISHDALRFARRSRGVEDIKRVCRGDGYTGHRFGVFHQSVPIQIARRCQFRLHLRTLINDAFPRFVSGYFYSFIEKRFVGNQLFSFDAAGCRNHNFRFGVVDADSQLIGSKTAEDNGMNGADPGAGKNGDQGFRYHGHVDDDGIAFFDAQRTKNAGKFRYLVQQFLIRNFLNSVCYRAVINNSRLFSPSRFNMIVNSVVAGV